MSSGSYLNIFIDRCSTEDDGAELLMSSSADFTTDKFTFGGEQNYWANFDMPGLVLVY